MRQPHQKESFPLPHFLARTVLATPPIHLRIENPLDALCNAPHG